MINRLNWIIRFYAIAGIILGSALLAGTMAVYAQRPELIMQSPHVKAITFVTISPDGKLLGSSSADGSIKLWDMMTSKMLWTFSGQTEHIVELAFSLDNKLLASASRDQIIKLWNIATRKELATFQSQAKEGRVSIAFSPDGRYLASGGSDGKVVLWDITERRLFTALGSHLDGVMGIAFSPNGRLLASGGRDLTIRLWDVETRIEKSSILAHEKGVTCVAFSPDNKSLVSCGPDGIKLWDVESGRLLSQALAKEKETPPSYAAFSPSGQLLASASRSEIRLWRVDQLRLLLQLKPPGDIAESITFSPDGKTLVNGGHDGLIRLWDVDLGVEYRTLTATADFNQENKVRDNKMPDPRATGASAENWLVITPDGLLDSGREAQNRLYWRYGQNIFDVAPMEAFAKDFRRAGLLSEILSEHPPHPPTKVAPYDQRQPRLEIGFSSEAEKQNKEFAQRLVSLKITVSTETAFRESTTDGVKDLRLFRNGVLVKQWPGDVKLNQDGQGDVEASVPIVAGENVFTADAYSHYGLKSNEARLAIIGASVLKRPGTLYILAIGIDEYASPELGLKYAVADAKSICEVLAASQRELGQYDKVEVVQLLNREATKANILTALDRLSERSASALPPEVPEQLANLRPAEPEDAVIVFFTCHAAENGASMFMAPYDLKLYPDDMKKTSSSGISEEELLRSVEKITPGKLAMILDICYAGNLLDNKEFARMSYAKQLHFLGASQTSQVAREYVTLKHGLMTYALVEEGLNAGAADVAPKDGQVTLREWLEYAVKRVPQLLEEIRKKTENTHTRSLMIAAPPRQTPRVFYKLESESPAWVISKVKPSLSALPK